MNILRTHRRKDEKAAEAVAMIFVIPVLVILVLGLIDVGMMFRARMLVENIARDAVRGAAADGGVYNPRTNTTGVDWETWAEDRLYKNHKCTIGQCADGQVPTIDCNGHGGSTDAGMETPTGGHYTGNVVNMAGDTITCVIDYPYKPINGALLNGPLGLGIGTLLKPFHIEVTARSETGDNSAFGVG